MFPEALKSNHKSERHNVDVLTQVQPSLYYEDVFKLVAVCKKADGEIVEFPLQYHKGKDHLCYSPGEGVVIESSVPCNLVVAKKPSGNNKDLKVEKPEQEKGEDDEG